MALLATLAIKFSQKKYIFQHLKMNLNHTYMKRIIIKYDEAERIRKRGLKPIKFLVE